MIKSVSRRPGHSPGPIEAGEILNVNFSGMNTTVTVLVSPPLHLPSYPPGNFQEAGNKVQDNADLILGKLSRKIQMERWFALCAVSACAFQVFLASRSIVDLGFQVTKLLGWFFKLKRDLRLEGFLEMPVLDCDKLSCESQARLRAGSSITRLQDEAGDFNNICLSFYFHHETLFLHCLENRNHSSIFQDLQDLKMWFLDRAHKFTVQANTRSPSRPAPPHQAEQHS